MKVHASDGFDPFSSAASQILDGQGSDINLDQTAISTLPPEDARDRNYESAKGKISIYANELA
jgi:hypothetical protein